jgi:hypothetical protein
MKAGCSDVSFVVMLVSEVDLIDEDAPEVLHPCVDGQEAILDAVGGAGVTFGVFARSPWERPPAGL